MAVYQQLFMKTSQVKLNQSVMEIKEFERLQPVGRGALTSAQRIQKLLAVRFEVMVTATAASNSQKLSSSGNSSGQKKEVSHLNKFPLIFCLVSWSKKYTDTRSNFHGVLTLSQ